MRLATLVPAWEFLSLHCKPYRRITETLEIARERYLIVPTWRRVVRALLEMGMKTPGVAMTDVIRQEYWCTCHIPCIVESVENFMKEQFSLGCYNMHSAVYSLVEVLPKVQVMVLDTCPEYAWFLMQKVLAKKPGFTSIRPILLNLAEAKQKCTL